MPLFLDMAGSSIPVNASVNLQKHYFIFLDDFQYTYILPYVEDKFPMVFAHFSRKVNIDYLILLSSFLVFCKILSKLLLQT